MGTGRSVGSFNCGLWLALLSPSRYASNWESRTLVGGSYALPATRIVHHCFLCRKGACFALSTSLSIQTWKTSQTSVHLQIYSSFEPTKQYWKVSLRTSFSNTTAMPPRGKTTPKGKGKGVAKPRFSTGASSVAGKRKPRASDVQRSYNPHSCRIQSAHRCTYKNCAHSRRSSTTREETEISTWYRGFERDQKISEQHRASYAETTFCETGMSWPTQRARVICIVCQFEADC